MSASDSIKINKSKLKSVNTNGKDRTWSGWSTVNELHRYWLVSKRRVQQILKELDELGHISKGILIVNETAKPAYKYTEYSPVNGFGQEDI